MNDFKREDIESMCVDLFDAAWGVEYSSPNTWDNSSERDKLRNVLKKYVDKGFMRLLIDEKISKTCQCGKSYNDYQYKEIRHISVCDDCLPF